MALQNNRYETVAIFAAVFLCQAPASNLTATQQEPTTPRQKAGCHYYLRRLCPDNYVGCAEPVCCVTNDPQYPLSVNQHTLLWTPQQGLQGQRTAATSHERGRALADTRH